MKKISFIIPVKNGEKYIRRCLNSILIQKYDDYEIIVIDNASTDMTKDIVLNEYKYDRVKYYYLDRLGVSIARNYGLKKAIGDYIIFVDVDDFIEGNTLDIISKYIEQEYDIVKFNYYFVKEKKRPKILFDDDTIFDKENKKMLFEIMYLSFRFNQLWGQAIKRECLENVYFNENLKMAEDYLFNYTLYKKCEKIICIKDILYNYVYNLQGINYNTSKEKTLKKIEDIMFVDELIYNDSENPLLYVRVIEEVFPHIINYFIYNNIEKVEYKDLLNVLRKNSFFYNAMNNYKKINIYRILILSIKYNFFSFLIKIFKLKKFFKRR